VLGAADNNSLLLAVTDFVSILLEGMVPLPVRGALFGAIVLQVAKKQGGIRPIAVGYVRRIEDKGLKGAAVRAARRYLDNMLQRGQLFLKIDFRI